MGAGNETTCAACAAGSYSTANAASAAAVCVHCEAGRYGSGAGATGCDTCASGQYCPLGSVASAACAAGSYCPNATLQLTTPAGAYSPAGATAPTPCRTYSPYAMQVAFCLAGSTADVSQCTTCFGGYHGDCSLCEPCPANEWCSLGAMNDCPLATNSPANSSDQNQCQCNAGLCPKNWDTLYARDLQTGHDASHESRIRWQWLDGRHLPVRLLLGRLLLPRYLYPGYILAAV